MEIPAIGNSAASTVDPVYNCGYTTGLSTDIYNNVVDLITVQSAKNTCMDKHLAPAKVSGLNYPLNKRPKGNCGIFGHTVRSFAINTIPEKTFEDQNQLTAMYKKLPYYLSNFYKANDDYRLMAMTRPSFINKAKCNAEDFKSFGHLVDGSDSITKAMYVFGIICIVLAVLVVILGLLVVMLRYKENNGFFTKPASLWVVHILAIITAILIIVFATIAMSAYSSKGISGIEAKFDNAITNKCLISSYVPPATYLRKYMKTVWDLCYPLGCVLFILSIIYLVLVFLAFLIRLAKKTSPCSPI